MADRNSGISNFFVSASYLRRLLFFLAADGLIICFSLFLAFFVHFEFSLNIRYLSLLAELLVSFVVLKIALLAAFRVYNITWRYVGINDLVSIFLAILLAELLLVVLSTPSSLLPDIGLAGISKRVFFVDGIVSFGLIAGLRVSKRIYLEVIREKRPLKKGKNTLIVGAGGSIGSEIVNQVCTFAPERVVLFDSDETELHNQGLKLARLYPNLRGRLEFVAGDVRDKVLGVRSPFLAFLRGVIYSPGPSIPNKYCN